MSKKDREAKIQESATRLWKTASRKKRDNGPKMLTQDEEHNCTYEPQFPPKGFIEQLFKRDPKRQPLSKKKDENEKSRKLVVPKFKSSDPDSAEDWQHQDKKGRFEILMKKIGKWDSAWKKELDKKKNPAPSSFTFQPDLKIGEKELQNKKGAGDKGKTGGAAAGKSSAPPAEDEKSEKKWEPFQVRLDKSLQIRKERLEKLATDLSSKYTFKPAITEWPPAADEKKDGESPMKRTVEGSFMERLSKDLNERKQKQEPALDDQVYTFKPKLSKESTEPGNINNFLDRLSKDLSKREENERNHITELLKKPTISPPKKYPRPKAMDGKSSKKAS